MEPDESKLYQLGPADEVELLKQDLILWPPIVVICNSSVDSMASKSKVVGLEAIECMLKGNQSIFESVINSLFGLSIYTCGKDA